MAETGWYPDPTDANQLRWFDGEVWTEHVQPAMAPPAADSPVPNPATAVSGTGAPAGGAAAPEVSSQPALPSMSAPEPHLSAAAGEEPGAPNLLVVVGVGVVALVWSQVLRGIVLVNSYSTEAPAWYGGMLVAGCGVTALVLWPEGRQRLLVAAPLGAVATSLAMLVLPYEWAPAAIGLGVGVAVGATIYSVGLGLLAVGAAAAAGTWLEWRWAAVTPFPVIGRLAQWADGTDYLWALGPSFIAMAAALGAWLAGGAAAGAERSADRPSQADSPSQSDGSVAAATGPAIIAASPEELMAFVTRQLVGAGALVTTQSLSGLSGHVHTKKKPSVLVAILLWFICIIPMVIYLVNSSKDVQEPFSLTFSPDAGGTRVEFAGVGRGLAAASWVVSQAAAAWGAKEIA